MLQGAAVVRQPPGVVLQVQTSDLPEGLRDTRDTGKVCWLVPSDALQRWPSLSAFPTMESETQGDETVLTGRLRDRSAVYGMLGQLEALGLELLELRRVGSTNVHP
ncbi:MAG: hypothetical protein JWO88_2609 [Frankiales bacterium]|nr:hypothetical protein [Frankiales bacterium]